MSAGAPTVGRRPLLDLALGTALSGVLGCSGGPSLVPIGGEAVAPEVIDGAPLALLPSGVLLFGSVDLTMLFQTQIGADVSALVSSLVPLGPESGFVPARDTERSSLGAYAMQGIDFCAVTQGKFDVAAIQRAADARAAAPSGLPVVKSRYRQFDLYTVGNIGFVLLTSRTVLSGNETGMRRALDRLHFKRLERSVPDWMVTLKDQPGAAFAVAGDFGADQVLAKPAEGKPPAVPSVTGSAAEPVLEAAAANFPFLSGLRALRVLGNFRAPGLNFAGTLSYATPEKASAGAESLRNLSDLAQWASLLTTFALGASMPPAQIALSDREVAFAQPVDTAIARAFVSLISGYVRRA